MVKFVRSYQQYNPGEIAGFSAAVEQDLIARGIAQPVKSGDATKAPATPGKPGPPAK